MRIAKYIASLCALTSISVSAEDIVLPSLLNALNKSDDPVLMIIGKEEYRYDTITRGEFEYMYNKNNNISLDGPMSIDDYKELFINYKLKSFDATKRFPDLKLNTYSNEMNSYTKHLAYPYLINKDLERKFVKEAYNREQEYISASHILIKGINEQSRKKIEDIYARLKKGEKFFDLAKANSDCGSASRGGYLGEFTVFDMVYNFETAAYNTPVGEFSEPFTTQFGYHIVYIHDRRPRAVSVKAQEIFFSSQTSESYVDSVFAIAKKAKKFDKVVKKYSTKKGGNDKNGDMGVVKRDGKYPKEVVDKLFNMPVGDIQKFRSSFGYHIFKLNSMETAEPLDSAKYADLKKRVMSGDRYEAVKENLAVNLRDKRGFLLNDSIITLASKLEGTDPNAMYDSLKKIDGTWYIFNGDDITTDLFRTDMLTFHSSFWKRTKDKWIKTKAVIDTNLSYKQNLINHIHSIVDKKALNDELLHIAKNNKEFVYALREYSDGLLVYAASDHFVWGHRASEHDSLDKFFRANMDRYKFDEPKWIGVIYCATDKAALKQLKDLSAKNPNLDAYDFAKLVTEKDIKGLSLKRGAWKAGENNVIDKYYYKTIPADSIVETPKFPLIYLYGEETKTPQWYTLVKGKVIADYQKELDKKWIERNRRLYPVIIKEDVYKTVNNH